MLYNLQQLYIAGSAPWASKAHPAGSEDVTDNTSSSRCSLSSAAVEHEMKNSFFFLSLKLIRKLHLRSPRTQSLHCLSSGWTRAAGGRWSPQFSQENGTTESGAFFPQKKGSQWTHSIPSRTERACSSPKHITHRSCVSSSVRQHWHGSTHLLKRFSTDIFLLTLQKQGPLKEKRGWCVPQVPLYARRRSLACVIGVHLPMPSALGVFNHASGNRRRSQSEPRKRTQCRVPFGREHIFTTSSGVWCYINKWMKYEQSFLGIKLYIWCM